MTLIPALTEASFSSGISSRPYGGDNMLFINLLLTRQCNYACAHCMYAASMKLPSGYMSDDDLEEIVAGAEDCAQYLKGLSGEDYYGISFNLVGGEPTLDLAEFARVLRFFKYKQTSHDLFCEFEMTTNAWWLERWDTTAAFMRAVSEGPDLRIRISDSPYHRAFRSAYLNHLLTGDTFKMRMGERYAIVEEMENRGLELGELFCANCDASFDGDDACCYECKNCGSESGVCEVRQDAVMRKAHEVFPAYLRSLMAEMISDIELFVDHQDTAKVSATGRARALQLGGQDGACSPFGEQRLTFRPGATVHDVCCNGGACAVGHARDGRKLLLRRASFMRFLDSKFGRHEYMTMQNNRCLGCATARREWMEQERTHER